MDELRGLRYKLRMMGVPIDGPSFIYADNKSAITANSSRPKSVLKKKCNSICYQACLANRPKRRDLVRNVLYDIYDYKQ
jgi:hypothetical protein